MKDPSDSSPDSGPDSGPDVSVLNELTAAVFELIHLIIRDDHDAANRVLHRVNDRHGADGMARVCIGMSAMMLWLTELSRESAEILRRLDDDPMATVNDLFHSALPGGGSPGPLRPQASQVVEAALRLVCLVNERTPQEVAGHLRSLFTDGRDSTRMLVGGLVLMMRATMSALNPWQQQALLANQASMGSTVQSPREAVYQAVRRAAPLGISAPAHTDETTDQTTDETTGQPQGSAPEPPPAPPFELPPGVRERILSVLDADDPADADDLDADGQAAIAVTRIAGPIILLHGEAGALAVFGMLATEVSDMLGFETLRQVNGGIGVFVPSFTGPHGHVCPDTAPSVYLRSMMLGFEFVTAWANGDRHTQRHLIQNDSLGAAYVVNGLCHLYRERRRYRQEIPS